MRVHFTKMQGAGNDFVVLDETRGLLGLSTAQYRWLADRHFGVGADQILSVRASPAAGIDFEYVIHNADGAEVEQCGNGARCFFRYVFDKGLTQRTTLQVLTLAGVISPHITTNGQVRVDMGKPVLALADIPFDAQGLNPLPLQTGDVVAQVPPQALLWPLDDLQVSVLSMGNPHAVALVPDVSKAPVVQLGPRMEQHWRFPKRVNLGFMQVVDPNHIRLRVWERGAGETLACGTGACAAVVAGIRLGLLDTQVQVSTRGGELQIAWSGSPEDSVMMTGPAQNVFEGEVDIPDLSAWPSERLAL
ncbi:MAG: diaminopimelate epimerase [Betaproteobacteria bacterium]|nr:diaminopimelate epimerase [Betaproteobacteria bacterium]